MQVSIPKPCSEDWNQMIPTGYGRHCGQCAKTVIDFSEMSVTEISFYLQINTGRSICGRFTEDQLAADIPAPEDYVLRVARAPLPFLKQIAALIIFALFIGAAPIVVQAKQKAKTTQQADMRAPVEAPPKNTVPGPMGEVALTVPQDTPVKYNEPVMGKIAMPPKSNKAPKRPVKKAPRTRKGDIQYIPDKQTSQKPTLQNQYITGFVTMPALQQKK